MMSRSFLPTLAVAIVLISSGLPSGAEGAEVRVLSAAVMKPLFAALTPEFERTSGHKLAVRYGPAGTVKSSFEAGAMVDVVIVQRPVANDLARKGKLNPRGMTTLARSGIAVAVRQGMRKPDISTIETFKQALLSAKSISYPDPAEGHAAGILFRKITERLGIAGAVAIKAKLQKRPFSESPPEDQADLAIAQPSEIAITPAYELVDLIPEDLQDYDQFSWTVAVAATAKEPVAAAALIKFLASSKAALQMKKMGMEPGAL